MAELVLDDRTEQRERALAHRLGVHEQLHLQTIHDAAHFTVGAPADAAPRPWRQWGARNLGGRIRALAQDPRNPLVIYAGAAQGGVFRSGDGGATWTAIGTPADSLPVGALAMAPSNPNILYVGTGEPAIVHDAPFPAPPASATTLAAREAFPAGVGFFRFDATTGALTNEVRPAIPGPPLPGSANSYAAIAVDPRNADRCWIASHTGLWRRDAGAQRFLAEPIRSGAPQAPQLGACVSDVILVENWDPERPAVYRLYAAVAGTGIFRGVFDPASTSGTDWDSILTGGLPDPGTGAPLSFDRIRIAACKSSPRHLYAVFENAADHTIRSVFRSTDGGDHWTACAVPASLGSQAWSTLCIVVHDDNPAIVAIGSGSLVRSMDGAATWETIADGTQFTPGVDRAPHADTYALMFDRREPHRLWVAHDGGISTADDVVNANPLTDRGWRRRSHGLCLSQFNDITSHPDYPFMLGGGLQEHGSALTFGGPTWLTVGDADGGQMCFEPRNSRQFVAPHQGTAAGGLGNLMQSRVVAGSTMAGDPRNYPLVLHAQVLEVASAPHDVFAVQISSPSTTPSNLGGLFVPRVIHHPSDVNQLMAGGTGDVAFSADGGQTYQSGGAGSAVGSNDVTALAYGPGATTAVSDWWIGTSGGAVIRGDGGVVPKTWTTVTPPMAVSGLDGVIITSIAVHPNDANYVVVATGGRLSANQLVVQGRVFLSNNRGANWMDITGLVAAFNLSAAAPAEPGTPRRRLPPGAMASLAFDPTVDPAGPQVLYAGTMGGVYVIRTLPRLAAGPPPIAPPAAFNPDWGAFNGPPAAPLPLTLVNDLEMVRLPARPGAAANSPESMPRLRLYAAMYGRGIFVCDVSPSYPAPVPTGGPARRLFMRQHVIEDGLAYPRIAPTVLNAAPTTPTYNEPQMQGDPRLPAIPAPLVAPPATGAFNDHSAIDIRVDYEPFQFSGETVDGVEFDEELRMKNLAPGRPNAIYVQVHNAGWDRFTQPVDVHLFFARGSAPDDGIDADPGAAPDVWADPAPLPNLHDNFWSNFTVEPELPSPTGPLIDGAARWQRVGKKLTIPADRLSSAHPAVVCFPWTPPARLSGGFVALLALCTGAEDALTSQPARLLNLRTLIREERRAAFRLVDTDPFTPDVYIRDSVDDAGRVTNGVSAGRSPDIIVVQTAVPDPVAAFADLSDTRGGDRIKVGVDQIIYVRVHNRSDAEVTADVELFCVKPNAALIADDPRAPAFDGTKWAAVAPVGPAPVTVPAHGWAIATVTWLKTAIPEPDGPPGTFNALAIAAIVSSTAGDRDPAPSQTRVFDAASFWYFFGGASQANNAALRIVQYDDTRVTGFHFDPPGATDDLGGPGDMLYEDWHTFISDHMTGEVTGRNATLGPGKSQFYNPSTTPTTEPSTRLTVTWKGFPMKFLRDKRDDRREAWRIADVHAVRNRPRLQDEYMEWFAHKNSADKITRIDFTAEAHDYWRFLGDHGAADPENSKILELYRLHIDPAVRADEIFIGGAYDMLNQWNTEKGAMHLTHRANTLNAEINLAALATVLWTDGVTPVTDPLQLIRSGGFGGEARSSDPRIGFDVNNLARLGLSVTLASPVGLLIDGLDDTGFLKPDGTPVGNYWTVIRGFAGGILRAKYEVPAAEGFLVGDITIGGQPVEFGGQIVENVTIKLVGLACSLPGVVAAPEQLSFEPGPAPFGLVVRDRLRVVGLRKSGTSLA